MKRSRVLASGVLLVFASSFQARAAEPLPDYLAGEVVARFSEAAMPQLLSPPHGSVPGFLARFGVTAVEPALRGASPHEMTPLERSYGFHRLFKLRVPDGVDLRALCSRLLEDPLVEVAHPNYLGHGGQARPDDTYLTPQQWDKDNTGQTGGSADADIDAVEAWELATGRPEIRVAVLDSGIDGDHIEFLGRVARGGTDLEPFEGGPTPVGRDFDPESDHPHGNWVFGVIGANTNNAFGVAGVNWWAPVIPLKILRFDNGGTTTDLIDGIRLTASLGAEVSNMSLIGYPDNINLANAVALAHTAGVVQIGCNGNSNTSTLNYPASYVDVVSTGWTNHSDLRAVESASYGSNFTPSLDIVGPGSLVRSVRWNTTSDVFDTVSGCSFATPHVAGITSVLLAVDPTLTQEQVYETLTSTAEDEVGSPGEDVPGRDNFYGWGRVNMEAALLHLGIASVDVVHVEDLNVRRVSSGRLEIKVAITDDLTGAEAGVLVEGTLAVPGGGPSVPLSAATGSNGVVTLVYEPGGLLPAGAYTFTVDAVSKSGFAYDPTANRESQVTHDPDLNGVHVQAIDLTDDFGAMTVEVQVLDDDGRPEAGVLVAGSLTPPAGAPIALSQTSRGATGGVARMVHDPAGDLAAGLWTFQVNSLTKASFTYESGRDVETSDTRTIVTRAGDADGDGDTNELDNCRTVSNGAQQDGDLDGRGDACDLCPTRYDAAQLDADGDGSGNRCDCSPYDASTVEVGEVGRVGFATKTRLVWNGVSGADRYDVSRGTIATLNGSDYGACLAENRTTTSLDDLAVPPLGSGYYYLVRGDDAVCGAGSLGPRSSGAERVNGNPSACL